MRSLMKYSKLEKGFSLLEITIAILLIGIILSAVLTSQSLSKNNSDVTNQQQEMLEVEQALTTYLRVNNHLPCPDTDNDGIENRSNDSGVLFCTSRTGTLPYITLNTSSTDVWGNPYRYRVNQGTTFANRVNDICESESVFGQAGARTVPAGFGYCEGTDTYYCDNCGAAGVCPAACDFGVDPRTVDAPPYFHLSTPPIGSDDAGESNNPDQNLWLADLEGNQIDNGIVVMVVSHGSNGAATWADCNISIRNTPSPEENENCDNDIVFSVPVNETEKDYLTWLTIYDAKRIILESGGLQ